MANKTEVVPKKRRGRPPKKDIAAKKEGNRKAVGRPKGDADAIREYKARLLASPKSRKVMDTILSAALDDDHKNQAAAWKLVVDRIMPLSYFDEAKNSGGKAAVNITITGVGGETTIVGEPQDDLEGDFINLNPETVNE
tara:strand:- start:855 stop:1271 length:417 start_codon:yes stop_codon:yes gene_type:complete